MIEAFESFNKINNLQSRHGVEALPRHPRHLTRSDSIHCLDVKWLILKAASIDSTHSSFLYGPRSLPLAAGRTLYGLTPTALRRCRVDPLWCSALAPGKPFLTDDEVSPLDGTALARQFQFLALRRLETTQPGPMMTGPTKTEDRRGMKLYGYVQPFHHRDREFPRAPQGRGHDPSQTLGDKEFLN